MSRVYVGNLDPRVSERELGDKFRTFGSLRNVWVARRPRVYAFVEFNDRRDAMDAIHELDGRNGWRVELSHNSKGGERGNRGGRGERRRRRRSPNLRLRKSPTYGHRVLPMAVELNLNRASGLQKLDKYLLTRYYITGDQASKDDIAIHGALSKPPSSEYVNASRWYNHINALLQSSPGVFREGNGVTVEGLAAIFGEAIPTDTKVRMDEYDEEDEDDEEYEDSEEYEDNEQYEEYEEDYVEDREPFGVRELSRESLESLYALFPDSRIVEAKEDLKRISFWLDVMPRNNKTDMKELEDVVRSVNLKGLAWRESKVQSVEQGLKKLRIRLTVDMDVDVFPLWRIQGIIVCHLLVKPANAYIRRCEVVSFNEVELEEA